MIHFDLNYIFDINEQMAKKNILPDTTFFNTFLQICKNSSAPSITFEAWAEMKKARYERNGIEE